MRKAWIVMWAVYFASVAIVINQFKVPPVMNILIGELDISMTQGGWLMSIFSVAGIILSIPAAFANSKYGPKITGIVALICTVVGSLVGCLASSLGILLLGRLIEGVGLGLIAVVAPAVIAMWFPPEKRSLPMGIWATWVPVGSFIMFNLATPIHSFGGWHGVWWFGTGIALVAFIIYVMVVNNPPPSKVALAINNVRHQEFSLIRGFNLPAPWLLGLTFAGMGFVSGYTSFGPQYFTEVHGVLGERANFLISLSPLMSIFSAIIAGWFIAKVKNTKGILVLSVILTTVIYAFSFLLPSVSWIIPFMLLLGFVQGFVATANFTLAPETMPDPALAGVALGINNLLFNLGAFLGPPALGSVVGGGNWGSGSYLLGTVMLGSVISSLLLSSMLAKKSKSAQVLNAIN